MSEKQSEDGMDLAQRLNRILGKPVKLSDPEKEKFREGFNVLSEWLEENEERILSLDRDQAYDQFNALKDAVAVIELKWKGTPQSKIKLMFGVEELSDIPHAGRQVEAAEQKPRVDTSKMTPEQLEEYRKWSPGNPDPDDPRFQPVDASRQFTAEDFEGWLNELTPKEKALADGLDCIRNYNEYGVEALCKDCSRHSLKACIREKDPSYTDSSTEFIKRQLENP